MRDSFPRKNPPISVVSADSQLVRLALVLTGEAVSNSVEFVSTDG